MITTLIIITPAVHTSYKATASYITVSFGGFKCSEMEYYGLSLQVSVPFIGLSFIGWIVFTAGFGLLRKLYEQNPNN